MSLAAEQTAEPSQETHFSGAYRKSALGVSMVDQLFGESPERTPLWVAKMVLVHYLEGDEWFNSRAV